MVTVAILFASCSKENKLNKRLDGSWNVVSIDGTTLGSDLSIVFSFSKDKKGKGTYSYTWTSMGSSNVETGTYVLTDDTKITITETGETIGDDYLIKDYSKTDMTVSDTDGSDVMVLKKK